MKYKIAIKCRSKRFLKPCTLLLLSIFFVGISYCQTTSVVDCEKKIGSLPPIIFQSNSTKLLPDNKTILQTVAAKMRNSPPCKIVVIGYGSSNKKSQQLSWDHVNTVINQLVDKEGISGDRFIFNYGQDGDPTTVDFRAASPGEDGPSNVLAPFPSLLKKN